MPTAAGRSGATTCCTGVYTQDSRIMPTPIVARTQPLHVVYGGAHLFKANTIAKLGELARRSATEFNLAEACGLNVEIAARVAEKLDHEPVEDFRIDFEDGFGVRPDDEE